MDWACTISRCCALRRIVSSSRIIHRTHIPSVSTFNKNGTTLVPSLSPDENVKAQNGRLVAHVQNAPDQPELGIDSVTIEQTGPVRAVLKVTGSYSGRGHAAFPFSVRFYISAGATAIRLVHFFIYDGDQFNDFIKGIGLSFDISLSDELYDRHVRFVTTDGGIWGEPVRVLSGLRRDATAAVLTSQFEGQPVPDISTWPTTVSSEVDQLPIWAEFTLDQLAPTRFIIAKRTDASTKASFLTNAGFGTKASGLGYLGGANAGGGVFALRDFWQSAPKGIDIRGASDNAGTVTPWAYSTRAPAMDMRYYDVVAHGLDLTYEDVGDPYPDSTGVGRSYEMTLQVVPVTPSRATLAQLAAIHTQVPQLVGSPEFYVSHNLFGGRWNVPDLSTSGSRDIEKRKSDLLDFYVAEIDQPQSAGLGATEFGASSGAMASTAYSFSDNCAASLVARLAIYNSER